MRMRNLAREKHEGISAVSLLTCMGLVTCCLVAELYAAGAISTFILLLWIVNLVARDPGQIIKYLPFYFAVIGNVAGCFLIEYGSMYLVELRTYACFSGSLPLLVFSGWLFLATLHAFDRNFGFEKNAAYTERASGFINVMTYCVLIIFLVLFASVAQNPSFSVGADRFQYASRLPAYFGKIWGWASFLIIFPGLALRFGNKTAGGGALTLYVLISIWIGEKFGPFLTLLWILILVWYDDLCKIGKDRLVKLSLMSFAAIGVLVVMAVGLQSITTTSSEGDYLSQRIAQQGQLWWKTYTVSDGSLHLEQLEVEINGLTAPNDIIDNVNSRHGIYGVMYLTAPPEVVQAKLLSGSRYSMAGFAAAYYCLGALGAVLFSFMNGLLIALLTNATLRALVSKRLVEAILFFRFLNIARTTFSMALLSQFFTGTSLVAAGALFFFWLMRGDGFATATRRGAAAKTSKSSSMALSNNSIITKPIDKILLDGKRATQPQLIRKSNMSHSANDTSLFPQAR